MAWYLTMAMPPAEVTAAADLQYVARNSNRIDALHLLNPSIPRNTSRAKYAAAFSGKFWCGRNLLRFVSNEASDNLTSTVFSWYSFQKWSYKPLSTNTFNIKQAKTPKKQ